MSNEDTSNKDLVVKIDALTELVEGLAGSTAKGFAEVHDEIANLRTELKSDIAKVDSKINTMQNRLDVHAGLDRQVEKLDKRVTRLEEKVAV